MEKLQEIFLKLLDQVPTRFNRYLWENIDWNHRMIAISGARGTGKTTFILQVIKDRFPIRTPMEVLYASMDDMWFSTHTLTDLAEEFSKYGGNYLFLDEVHKYPGWSREVKNLYDSYPRLKIVFTGSSLLEIYRGEVDLSRRVAEYHLHGMSFREYLNLQGADLNPVSLEELLSGHLEISSDLNKKIEFPLLHFRDYLKKGYYPFFKESGELYLNQLSQVVNLILENDIPAVQPLEYPTIIKIKKLLLYLASSSPFRPNVSKLSGVTGINRNQLVELIHLLHRAKLINNLSAKGHTLSTLAKPEKIYLNNTNLYFALGESPNEGSLRETFFLNQTMVNHKVNYSETGDFSVDDMYVFEVGGKSKDSKQIKDLENAFIAADNIEYGIGNKIPLWLFGFLY